VSRLARPSSTSVEVIVVDNGSTDQTRNILADWSQADTGVDRHVLFEPMAGKSRALNRALRHAGGDVLLFTDDDVLPPNNWIEGMCAPVWDDKADAVAGGLKLSDRFSNLSLDNVATSWLATTEHCTRPLDPPLIGANMAVARCVFDQVPCFDEEIGPGALGHAEDTLFWLQVREAGFRVVSRYSVIAVHDPDPARATRQGMARQAELRGEFAAFVEHHWEHLERKHYLAGYVLAWARLFSHRLTHARAMLRSTLMSGREAELLEHFHFRRRLLRERWKSRVYARRGLVRSASADLVPQ
jgi:glucosyl-dolichyl phosphate glucuronosyltransferase